MGPIGRRIKRRNEEMAKDLRKKKESGVDFVEEAKNFSLLKYFKPDLDTKP